MEPATFSVLCIFGLIITILLCVVLIVILKYFQLCCFEQTDSRESTYRSVGTNTDETNTEEANVDEHIYESIPDIGLRLDDYYMDDSYSDQESLHFEKKLIDFSQNRIYFELEQEAGEPGCHCEGACNCNRCQDCDDHFYH